MESDTGEKPSNQNNHPVAQGNDIYKPKVINTMSKNNVDINTRTHTHK